jgi:ribonuclease HI
VTNESVVIYTDGGSRGNPGPAGIGAVITKNDDTLATISEFLGSATNNVAEYTALIKALEKALELGIEHAEVRMDSELIVRQMNGQYRVKNQALIPLFQKAKGLVSRLKTCAIVHVRREFNKDADRLANQAMDLGV